MTFNFSQSFSMSSFVAGVMLGALLVGAWFSRSDTLALPTQSTTSLATSTKTMVFTSGTLSVVDQPSGDTVIVESVTVPPPGVWVAVREVLGNDLGNVLGAAHIGGPRSNISVSLLRETVSGRPYAVELYRDDSGGEFSPSANSVYIDFDTGAPVISYFMTTE